MKNSATTMLLVLFLLGGAVAGLNWLMQSPAPMPPVIAAAPAKPKIEPPPEAPPPPPDNGPSQQLDMSDPDVRAMVQQRVDDRYGDLLGAMNLTQQQQDSVTDLMAQRFQATRAIYRDAYQNGYDPNIDPAQLQQQVAQATAGFNQALQATVGPVNFLLLQARDQEIRANYQNGGGPGGG